MSNHNLPTESGLYWASDLPVTEDWELIVKVSGKVPFMRGTVWKYYTTQPITEYYKVENLFFGPKLEIPTRKRN